VTEHHRDGFVDLGALSVVKAGDAAPEPTDKSTAIAASSQLVPTPPRHRAAQLSTQLSPVTITIHRPSRYGLTSGSQPNAELSSISSPKVSTDPACTALASSPPAHPHRCGARAACHRAYPRGGPSPSWLLAPRTDASSGRVPSRRRLQRAHCQIRQFAPRRRSRHFRPQPVVPARLRRVPGRQHA
jgi:hypothetical protein